MLLILFQFENYRIVLLYGQMETETFGNDEVVMMR